MTVQSFPACAFSFSPPFTPGVCISGTVLPTGTPYQYSAKSGAAASSGCELAMQIGGPNNGLMEETGSQVAAPGTSSATAAPASQTTNPNGSTTYCETNTSICVTSNAPAPAPAATPNATTSSTTNNPASTSTTATTSTTTGTTTTTGDGSGSGSSGTGTSSSTTSTTGSTTVPASASSTSCTTGVCDVGNADGSIGALYNPSGDTPGSVYSSFVAQVSSTPIISASTGFFTLNVSGTCPTFTIPGNKYWGQAGFTFSFFCTSAMLALFQLAGFLVLAVAAYAAFKIALY